MFGVWLTNGKLFSVSSSVRRQQCTSVDFCGSSDLSDSNSALVTKSPAEKAILYFQPYTGMCIFSLLGVLSLGLS